MTEDWVLSCKIRECLQEIYCLNLCLNHYNNPPQEILCSIVNCNNIIMTAKMCAKHYQTWKRNNPGKSPSLIRTKNQFKENNLMWHGDQVTYKNAHLRIWREHGPAKNWTCVGKCGKQAQQWAYCHSATNELQENKSGKILYRNTRGCPRL